ncbi:hypothetical protein [Clostridium sp. JS66]|uniref:hypothetical protein n=1 Tax=Clostridium sp. JS66 TaxID=3064705 RepID=UPI00298D6556|nr:hypothetical protein [Clostridium sp. JS66]WPC39927.1 hypothetical protein Q6H37_18700 [Clostridium sp. JS66]
MNREHVKDIIKAWIQRINEGEVLSKDIVALNFGLYEPYGIELIGSANYDEEDDDWACEEDFVPIERNCPDLDIDDTYEWESVLKEIESILKELVQELKELPILQVEHITTGFCDGDLIVVK